MTGRQRSPGQSRMPSPGSFNTSRSIPGNGNPVSCCPFVLRNPQPGRRSRPGGHDPTDGICLGLYHQDEDLDWWQEHWRRGNETWSGMTCDRRGEFVLSWQRSGRTGSRPSGIPPSSSQVLAGQWSPLAGPRRPLGTTGSGIDPSLDSLSVSTDLPFLLDLGLSADRVAGMFAAFDLTNAGTI